MKAKDLTKEAPRSPRTRLGGYVILGRMIDKGRAVLAETAGEYHFACPLDQILFGFKEVKDDEVKALLQSGATDEQIVAWFDEHGAKKTKADIDGWTAGVEAYTLYNDSNREKHDYFVGECTKLGLDPAKATLFDWLEADDLATFKN